MSMPTAEGYVCCRWGSGHTEGTGPTAEAALADAVARLAAAGCRLMSPEEAQAARPAQDAYVLRDELEVLPATAAAVALGVGAQGLHECHGVAMTPAEADAVYRAEVKPRRRRAA